MQCDLLGYIGVYALYRQRPDTQLMLQARDSTGDSETDVTRTECIPIQFSNLCHLSKIGAIAFIVHSSCRSPSDLRVFP